jgi:hypothetical protein
LVVGLISKARDELIKAEHCKALAGTKRTESVADITAGSSARKCVDAPNKLKLLSAQESGMKQFLVLVLVLTLAVGASVAMTARSITAAANCAECSGASPRAIW